MYRSESHAIAEVEPAIDARLERVKKPSWVWQYVAKLKGGDERNRAKTLCGFACLLCLEKGLQWRDCLLALHNGAPANGTSHLKNNHSSVCPQKVKTTVANS